MVVFLDTETTGLSPAKGHSIVEVAIVDEAGRVVLNFSVTRSSEKFGALQVSRGSLVWYPQDKKIGHKMSWVEFDQEAQKYLKRERR